jgi:hypothetical protein
VVVPDIYVYIACEEKFCPLQCQINDSGQHPDFPIYTMHNSATTAVAIPDNVVFHPLVPRRAGAWHDERGVFALELVARGNDGGEDVGPDDEDMSVALGRRWD